MLHRLKKSRRLPPQRLELTTDARFQTSQLPEPVKDNVEYTDGNRVETDHAWVPGDEAHSDDEEQRDIAETDALLQSPLVQRSLSCPARTPIDDGDVRGIMYSSAHSFKDCDS